MTPHGRSLRSADTRLSGLLLEPLQGTAAPLLVCIHGGGCNGRYYDLKGYSTVKMAVKRGLPVLVLDRPGHGGSEPLNSDAPIRDSALPLKKFIDEVRADHPTFAEDIILIGHSIGGAVALNIAAASPDWPVRAVAVSGIGNTASSAANQWFAEVLAGHDSEPPASFFFGPEGSYSWKGAAALRQAVESWRSAEVVEVLRDWPRQFPDIAGKVTVPVHLRLAEHEGIWSNGPEDLGHIRNLFYSSRFVDIGLLPGGGHIYEIHHRGAELVESQLDFLETWAAARLTNPR